MEILFVLYVIGFVLSFLMFMKWALEMSDLMTNFEFSLVIIFNVFLSALWPISVPYYLIPVGKV